MDFFFVSFQVRKIIINDDDQKIYANWDFISKQSFQEEVVEFLLHEDKLVSITLS